MSTLKGTGKRFCRMAFFFTSVGRHREDFTGVQRRKEECLGVEASVGPLPIPPRPLGYVCFNQVLLYYFSCAKCMSLICHLDIHLESRDHHLTGIEYWHFAFKSYVSNMFFNAFSSSEIFAHPMVNIWLQVRPKFFPVFQS